MNFIEKTGQAISKQSILSMSVISFLSSFREGAETIIGQSILMIISLAVSLCQKSEPKIKIHCTVAIQLTQHVSIYEKIQTNRVCHCMAGRMRSARVIMTGRRLFDVFLARF